MLKFSCADFTFPMLNRVTALQLVRLLGFDHVDVGLFARSTHFSPEALRMSPKEYTRQVRQDLDAAELQPADVFLQSGIAPSDFASNDPNPIVQAHNRDTFKQSLELCVSLGCRHLTGLPGVFHSGVSRERDVAYAQEVANWRVSLCASAGICYSIEPHVGSITPDVRSTLSLLTAVDGLTLSLDYGHFVMNGEGSTQIHQLLRFASHIHLRGAAPGLLQAPVKDNTVDYSGMIRRLTRMRFDGFLALEYVWTEWNRCNQTDNVSETVMLRRSIEALLQEGENGDEGA